MGKSVSKGLRSKENEAIYHAVDSVVDLIAKAFGSNCEVILHSLEDLGHTVIKIVNGHVTGRKLGSPMTDFGMDILEKAKSLEKDVIGSYYSQLDNEKSLKSASMLIRNARGDPIGMLCINLDLSAPLLDFVRELLPEGEEFTGKIVEHFPSNLNELVERTLETVMSRVGNQREIPHSMKNKAIVMELYKKGMFKVAGVIDILAKNLGISRYTVYNYIREARMEVEEG